MENEKQVVETALLQVKIGEEWVTYQKISRTKEEHWDGNILCDFKPQTRIVFENR